MQCLDLTLSLLVAPTLWLAHRKLDQMPSYYYTVRTVTIPQSWLKGSWQAC